MVNDTNAKCRCHLEGQCWIKDYHSSCDQQNLIKHQIISDFTERISLLPLLSFDDRYQYASDTSVSSLYFQSSLLDINFMHVFTQSHVKNAPGKTSPDFVFGSATVCVT